jgi:hypothetical protein
MSPTPPPYFLPWLGFDEDRSWVPLYRAPFIYRITSEEDRLGPWDSATLGRELTSRLEHLGVRDAIIDPSCGGVTLILSAAANRPSNLSVRFHFTECNPDVIPDERLREAVLEWVALMVSRVRNWLRRALEQRCCATVARPISMLNGFIPIGPTVFSRFRLTDLQEGEAVNAAGEMLFCLRVTPPDFGSSVQEEHRLKLHLAPVEGIICDFLLREYPNGKPPRLSYDAITARINSQTGLNVSEAYVRRTAQNRLGWLRRRKKA